MEARCRICSRTEPFESVSLSSRSEAYQETIFNMITYCTQLEVSPDDSLPQQICCDCLANLTGAFEFRRLCHRSDASFRQMLRREEVPPAETDLDTGPTVELDRTSTYQCCFKRCDHTATDYAKLREHAKRNHQTRRHGNALRRGEEDRFVCAICMGGFRNRLEWNIHCAVLQGVQRFHCVRCSEPFRTEEQLDMHLAGGRCRPQEEDRDEGTEGQLDQSLQQHLIRRILRAKTTDSLVKIRGEHKAVLENKDAFLDRLHRNELKHSAKRVNLFYVCKACDFRTEIHEEVVTHLEIGKCLQGFYAAFGFRAVKLQCVQSLQCQTCGYRTGLTANMKRHQRLRNHSGICKTRTTKPVGERDYPCEFCETVFSNFRDRKLHRTTCLRNEEMGSKEASEPLINEDVTVDDQRRVTEDTASRDDCGEQPESLLTDLKVEDYDPLEAMDQSADDQEQEAGPPTKEVNRPCSQREEDKDTPQALLRHNLKGLNETEHDAVQENEVAFIKQLTDWTSREDCGEQSEPLLTDVKVEDYDPLEAMDQSADDHEQEAEPPTKEVNHPCSQREEDKDTSQALLRHSLVGLDGTEHDAVQEDEVVFLKQRQCSEPFRDEEQLEMHLAMARCRPQEEDRDEATTGQLLSSQQHLIQRILRAKVPDGLVRINQKDYKAVQQEKDAFLERLHQNELKNSGKRVNLFYVCEACDFRTEIHEEVVTHLKIGKCLQGFYIAFGFRAVMLYNVQSLQCQTCGYRTESTGNMKRHQRIRNHSGISKTRITKPLAERTYPCKNCGTVFTTYNNRKRHRSTCLRHVTVQETGSKEATEQLVKEEVIVHDQGRISEDMASREDCEEQSESLLTDFKVEEYDQSADNQEQEAELFSKEGNREDWEEQPESLLTDFKVEEYDQSADNQPQETELSSKEVNRPCLQREEGKDALLASLRQDLIERIQKAQATNSLVILRAKATDGVVGIGEEYKAVLEDKDAFLDRLHRNELKNSGKRVNLFYVCEACDFRTEIHDEVVTHLEIGTCLQGFYIAFGFRAVKLHCVQSLQCQTCGYRTGSTGNMKRHQRLRNHSGISKTQTTKPVAERDYPCEYCGTVFTTYHNRNRHRSTCLHVAAQKTGSKEATEPLGIEDVIVHDQGRISEDTASREDCEEQPEPLLTDLKVEECDPLEAMDESADDQGQEAEPSSEDVNREDDKDTQQASLRQELIRRIQKAKATNSLVRLNGAEHDAVKENEAAFLKQLQRIDLKHPSKRVKLFHVCEACHFRTEVRDEVQTHLAIGTCAKGFYMALGFRMVKLRRVQVFYCEMCKFRCENSCLMRRHQQSRDHYGVRATSAAKQVAEREYPCEFCGRIFTTFHNRKRHRRKCSSAPEKFGGETISNESKESQSIADMSSEDTASNDMYKEQQESPLTDLTTKGSDLVDTINQSPSDQEQATEPPTTEDLTCKVCNYTTIRRGNLNRHLKTCPKKPRQTLQRLRKCNRCQESFPTNDQLAKHVAVGGCRQHGEEWSQRQDLTRRILEAQATDDLVRISQEEHDIVMEKKGAFLKQLHRNELKHSIKRVKLFYVCEACNFRSEIRDEVLTHLNVGTCMDGLYMALGFRLVNMRSVQTFECKMCNFRTVNNTGNMRRHQLRRNHSGIRRTKTTKEVAEKEYPCEYCGRVFTLSSNRLRHRGTCSSMPGKTISNKAPSSEDTASKEQTEPLLTDVKIEECDLRENINQSPNDPEQDAEHGLNKRGRKRSSNGQTVLNCTICDYTTNKRGNLNRHLKTCLLKGPPMQSTYFGSSDSE